MRLIPDSEVVNNTPSILIIGYGWVGQYVGKYFCNADYVDDDGVVKKVNKDVVVKETKSWDLGFICVPTPMGKKGRCDMSIVDSVVQEWKDRVKYFCCKSTVEIGTCDKYNNQGISFCFSPEYIGETIGHPLTEPNYSSFVILGGPKNITKVFAEAWTLVTNSYTKIYQTDGKTAELTKLMENSFIATKVSFVNEFFELSEAIGVDFNELRELWLADPRVSRSHTYCFRNNRGFGGKCLPKDLSNIVSYFKEEVGVDSKFIEFLLKYNTNIRKKAEKENDR